MQAKMKEVMMLKLEAKKEADAEAAGKLPGGRTAAL